MIVRYLGLGQTFDDTIIIGIATAITTTIKNTNTTTYYYSR